MVLMTDERGEIVKRWSHHQSVAGSFM